LRCRCSLSLLVQESLTCFNRLPDTDHEVRWCLLKLADLLIRPVEETPPTVKIHIPSTPVIEAVPPINPPIKAKVPQRITVKTEVAPAPSKLRNSSISTKLKLPGTPAVSSPRIPSISVPPVAEAPVKKGVSFAQPSPPPAISHVSKKDKARSSKPVPASPTKPIAVPRAQSGGLTFQDLKGCQNALKKLQANKHALFFLHPVDPVRDHAPKYVISLQRVHIHH
jgi:transcription initiation factor TFIID subunit 2